MYADGYLLDMAHDVVVGVIVVGDLKKRVRAD